MIELRDYQQDAIAELDKLWPTHRATILGMPTGAGKTVTTAAWLDGIFGRQPNTVGGWMVHTGHLREQAGRGARQGRCALGGLVDGQPQPSSVGTRACALLRVDHDLASRASSD